jgi:flavorubredoxin
VKTTKTIFQEGNHKWIAIVRDPEKPNYLIDTNEYLVTHGGQGLLLDPGGAEIFPAVFSALSSEFDPSSLAGVFASHQDPDICSSLALWLEFNPRCAATSAGCGEVSFLILAARPRPFR